MKIANNFNLKNYNTFNINVKCNRYITLNSKNELINIEQKYINVFISKIKYMC